MKKFSLAVAAFGLMMFVACGDDSSSSPSNQPAGGELPASVNSFVDVDNYACSQTENYCKKMFVKDINDTAICVGNMWGYTSNYIGMPSVCDKAEELASSSSNASSNPVPEQNVLSSSSEAALEPLPASSASTNYVCSIYTLSDALSCDCNASRLGLLSYNYDTNVELVCIYDDYLNMYGWVTKEENSSSSAAPELSSSSEAVPELSSSSEAVPEVNSSSDAAPSEAGLTGDLVSCEVNIEGVFGEHFCKEISASDANLGTFKTHCSQAGAYDGMHSTVGTACPTGAVLSCPGATANVYSYDAANASANCASFIEGSMASAL